MRYDAVVFDNDGVLVEPPAPETLREAARRAFREVGVEGPHEDHVEAVFTGVSVADLEAVCDAYGVDIGEFWRARDRHAAAAQREEFRRGDRALYDDFDAVAGLDCPRGIVSSNQHETVAFVLDYFEVGDRFDTYYGRRPTVADVRRKKPDPHFVERAVADLDAASALFVGDSESDVRAAENAGVDSAFVRRSHREDYELSVEPTYERESLADLAALA
jgi:HAD superfamily hydrolase (TIGR01549 family)